MGNNKVLWQKECKTMQNTKYLIIGNGIAGLSAAKEIRKKMI